MTVIQATVVVPSNPADQKKIFDAIKEADNSLIRMDAEKEQVKAIVEMLHDEYTDLPKKYINKMIKTYHKQNFNTQTAEMADFEELYTTVVK